MKQSVLHFASGDAWGGAERALSLLVEGTLATGSVEVAVLLANEGRLAATLRQAGVVVHVIPEQGASWLGYARSVRRWFAERRFDVVHVHRYKEIALALLVVPRRRSRLVVTVHGLEPASEMGRARSLLIWTILGVAGLRGARFVAVSEELASRLRRLRTRVVRIPNPMPPPETAPAPAPDLRARFGWEPERPLVGFVGRLEEVKGPDRLLDVAARGSAAFAYVFVGGGGEAEALGRRVQAEGLADRVGFLGEIEGASGVLRQLDVLALPSRHEGHPMVLMEAAACGTPVVAFEVGGVGEILEGGPPGWLIPDGDLDAFAAALEAVVRAPDPSAIARWAAAVEARFGIETMVSATLRLYRGRDALEAPGLGRRGA